MVSRIDLFSIELSPSLYHNLTLNDMYAGLHLLDGHRINQEISYFDFITLQAKKIDRSGLIMKKFLNFQLIFL